MSAVPDLRAYRRIVVAFSGGKDSLAALLRLLALGVPAHAIERKEAGKPIDRADVLSSIAVAPQS